ncbi:MAG TPA: 30S ribosomal protein S6 [Elusimicrobiales bacterium]|nr:30S ribosomal protein S6 [Elusimicrobiales bacterium]
MFNYETIIVLRPQVSDEEAKKITDAIGDFIKKEGGEVISAELPGRRKLSYEINDNREGFEVFIKLKANPQLPAKLSNYFKLHESVMRSMIVKSKELKKTAVKKPVVKK